jgi:hypothetical protein
MALLLPCSQRQHYPHSQRLGDYRSEPSNLIFLRNRKGRKQQLQATGSVKSWLAENRALG